MRDSALIALLAAVVISGGMGRRDYVLLPAMAVFAGATIYAVVCRIRRAHLPL